MWFLLVGHLTPTNETVMQIEDLIITAFIKVDNFLKDFTNLRSKGPKPKLSDSEVITMEIIGEFLGLGSDKRIFDHFYQHWI